MSTPESVKYQIIREMTTRDNNLMNIKWLCEAAGVSRSGYYNWLAIANASLNAIQRYLALVPLLL